MNGVRPIASSVLCLAGAACTAQAAYLVESFNPHVPYWDNPAGLVRQPEGLWSRHSPTHAGGALIGVSPDNRLHIPDVDPMAHLHFGANVLIGESLRFQFSRDDGSRFSYVSISPGTVTIGDTTGSETFSDPRLEAGIVGRLIVQYIEFSPMSTQTYVTLLLDDGTGVPFNRVQANANLPKPVASLAISMASGVKVDEIAVGDKLIDVIPGPVTTTVLLLASPLAARRRRRALSR